MLNHVATFTAYFNQFAQIDDWSYKTVSFDQFMFWEDRLFDAYLPAHEEAFEEFNRLIDASQATDDYDEAQRLLAQADEAEELRKHINELYSWCERKLEVYGKALEKEAITDLYLMMSGE